MAESPAPNAPLDPNGRLVRGVQDVLNRTHGPTIVQAVNVLDHLRSLPVEQRMEAMGVTRLGGDCDSGAHWIVCSEVFDAR